jgi:hypothetical protein
MSQNNKEHRIHNSESRKKSFEEELSSYLGARREQWMSE